jgi:hypothetical protein
MTATLVDVNATEEVPDGPSPFARSPFLIPEPLSETGYERAPGLTKLGGELIAEYPELADCRNFRIKFLWKHRGGKALGRCLKVGDLAAHYSDADYVVWLAIDTVTEQTLADRQITALLFHELLHVQEVLDKEGNPTGKAGLRQHDIEEFAETVNRFGLWHADLRPAADAIHTAYTQGRLL